MHFAIWKRGKGSLKPKENVPVIWQRYYPLIESKAKESLIPLLMSHVKKQATKSAFAVLNARTTSHNTGSHILVHDLTKSTDDSGDLNNFHNYMRQRMLYNSDIAAANPSFEVAYSLVEIKEKFENLNIVKKYISGYKGKKFGNLILDDGVRNIKVAISNGILGLQAFFIILENIIRNHFKHANSDTTELNINLRVEEASSEYLKLILSDGSKIESYKKKVIEDLICQTILDNKLKLRHHGLGFLEMKGAVCYLNAIPLEQIDNAKIIINNVELDPFSVANPNNKLEFHLYIRKPKELLILDNPNTYSQINVLNNIGVFVKNEIDIKNNEQHKFLILVNNELLKKIEENLSALPHRIFVLDNNLTSPNQNKYPQITKDDLNIIKNATGIDTIFNILYPKWVNHILGKKKLSKNNYVICTNWNEEAKNYYQIYIAESKLIKEEFYVNEEKNIIYFDGHEDHYNDTKDVFYYEGLVSLNLFKNLLDNFIDRPLFFIDQIFESVFTKIAIVDERIQSQFGATLENEKLRKRNIFVPLTARINLNESKYNNGMQKKLTSWIKGMSESNNSIDYLIIHLGIIEKFLSNSDIDKSSEEVRDWIEKIFLKHNKVKRIIITSERGTPENIPDDFGFVHFSNLHYNLIDIPSKFSLVNILFSSRKRVKS
jgi:hypothetical protein